MRWLVEITDITGKRFFNDLLARLNITLFSEEDRIYLISGDFDSLSTCFEIWTRVNQIRDIVCEISSGFNAVVSFKLGTVYEQKEDGSRHGTVFRSGQPGLLTISAEGGGTWTLNPPISAEEKLRLEAERLEREYQNKLDLVSCRVLLALRDDRALKVHRFLQQELTPLRMGHIIDLIEADLGGGLKSLAAKNELGNKLIRFSRSINHPEVFGDDSRHAIPKGEPPAKPMSLSEAQIFVARIANLWFEQKCIDDNDA